MIQKMMTAVIIAGLWASAAAARPRGVGLGLSLGEPAGLSLKVWTSENFAYDAGLGFSWLRYGQSFHIHADLLWHTSNVLSSAVNGFMPLYLGVGGRIKMSDPADNFPDERVGIRFPFGLEYVFVRQPVGLFIELVPVMDLIPGIYVDGSSVVGFRYYFR